MSKLHTVPGTHVLQKFYILHFTNHELFFLSKFKHVQGIHIFYTTYSTYNRTPILLPNTAMSAFIFVSLQLRYISTKRCWSCTVYYNRTPILLPNTAMSAFIFGSLQLRYISTKRCWSCSLVANTAASIHCSFSSSLSIRIDSSLINLIH